MKTGYDIPISAGPEDLCDRHTMAQLSAMMHVRDWWMDFFRRTHAPADLIRRQRQVVAMARLAIRLKLTQTPIDKEF